LLTIAEAVKYLRLGQSTIYEILHKFEIVRLGRRIFITKKSADAYIAANTRPPARPSARKRASAST
jgi:excisionase family DNA binding protein